MGTATVIANAKTATFEAAGSVGAPPIVLVHGAVVTRKMWLPQLRALSDEYRVIAPDLPGHGALAGIPFQLDSAVQVLSDIIGKHAGGRAVIVGSSLGGYVAMAFAQRYPQQVAGLVLSGSSVNFRGVLGVYVKAVGFLLTRAFSERWLNRLIENRVRRMFPASLQDVWQAQIEAGVYPRAAGECFLELGGKDFCAVLHTFPGPVLILNGENDRPNRKGEAAFVAAAQKASVQTVKQAGHACSIEQPEAFTSAVRGFATAIGRKVFVKEESGLTTG